MAGLRKLEYRGYDSAGLAVLDSLSTIGVARAAGKLDKLDDVLREHPLLGSVGVGHTRWATHGHATVANAHPHVVGRVAVVHNGIIENYAALRAELELRGRHFASETDTEVISHLIDIELEEGAPTLLEATRRALGRLHGSYAIAVVSGTEPGTIVVAKQFSPLVLGASGDESYAASDVPALLTHTRDVIYLEDGDIAELHSGVVHVERVDTIIASPEVNRPSTRVAWSPVEAERHGYKHFMLKEIFEQPAAIEATLRGRLLLSGCALDAAET
ncbi:MAG: glutamine--fructose-6-phosphate aminotransferase, partial [Deltaproteobacteria bacterium]